MKKMLLFVVFISAVVFAQPQEKVLIVSLMFNGGQMSFGNAFTQEGVFASEMNEGSISGKIYSVEGDEIFSFKFEPDNLVVIEDAGVVEETEFKQVLVLPYYGNAEKIVFLNGKTGQELAVPIAFLSKLCGNKTCDVSEAFGNCPSDCPSGGQDSYCDRQEDDICDPDCEPKFFDADCRQIPTGAGLSEQEIEKIVRQKTGLPSSTVESFPAQALWAGLIAGVVLIVLGFFFLRKKNKG
ncbi:MAG: hypothetical protein HY392_03275 [Candidatus Diapherotrites archaeon]|nr:hypothetical protein [Candidatus Diapherotrites archaeon]